MDKFEALPELYRDSPLISYEMERAGVAETSHDPNYPHSEMVRDVFAAMLNVALRSPQLRCKYLALLSELLPTDR